jgi:competence protein ComEC
MSRTLQRLCLLWALIVVLGLFFGCSSDKASVNTPAPTSPASSVLPTTNAPGQTPVSTPNTPAATPSQEPTPEQTEAREELAVHFIDVGQGDAILIDLKDIEVLIDGGDRSPGVVPCLKKYVDGPLEAMIATHPHADHIGGLIDVLAAFQVQQVWYNGETATSKTYTDFMSAVKAENAQVFQAVRGNTVGVDGLAFKVLNPVNLEGTVNNNSIVLYLSYGTVDFLFMGDAEREAEAAMLVRPDIPVPDIEILKVGHHGSNTASSEDFLTVTTPEIAVYMAGVGNSYGHPHPETIVALNDVGAKIYGTDIHGNIIVTTDGEKYELQLEKQALPVTVANAPTTTPTSTHTPTPTPSPTPEPQNAVNVQITHISYDGQVPRVESDEYVEITNIGTEPVDLAGWVLKDIFEGYPSFTFPSYNLQPGKNIRVYTNEIHPEYGGFSFHSGKAVWNNTDPDTAALYNAQGQEVSRKSY